MAKTVIYIIVTVLVIYALESVNINQIFKKNRIMQSTLVYFFIALSLIYLVTNFFYDIYTSMSLF